MLSLECTRRFVGQAMPHPPSFRRQCRLILAGTALSVATMAASGISQSWAQPVQLVAVDVKAVAEGYPTSELIGTRVKNDKGERIGALDDLVITDDKKLFAILQVGGFLGLGGHLVAVPYDSLQISEDGREITLAGGSREALEDLPEFQSQ